MESIRSASGPSSGQASTIPPANPAKPEPVPLRGPGNHPEFADVLRRVGQELVQGEKIVGAIARGALSGRAIDHGELLALQAQVYRHSELVDLASKVVEKGTSALRTIAQSQ